MKVRTLLDRAARTIEGKFREQPLTEAAIRLTVGKAYRALGQYPEAQPQLERSVELFDAELGPDHPVTLRSKSSLAYLYGAQGKYDQAERLSLDVVKGRAARLGANHPDTLTSKNDLAQQYRAQKKYDQAEPLYLQVVRPIPRHSAPTTPKPCAPGTTSRLSTGIRGCTTRRSRSTRTWCARGR